MSTWGGKRIKAGRKISKRPRVRHRPRRDFETLTAVLVTFRIERGLWVLRRQRVFKMLVCAFSKACERLGTRIIHFAVLGNHVHLVVESSGRIMLSRAMKGIGVRIARGMNRLLSRSGKVIAHRHHTSLIRSVKAAIRVIRYVRENYRKHFGKPDEWRTGVTIDPCSSWANVLELPKPQTHALLTVDPFG